MRHDGHRESRSAVVLLVAALSLVLLACGSPTRTASSASSIATSASAVRPAAPDCNPSAGGRCAGPAPIARWLSGPLTLSADGRTISGDFECGGALTESESQHEVTLTFVADAVEAGALSCDKSSLTANLRTALGDRALVDGTTHQPLSLG